MPFIIDNKLYKTQVVSLTPFLPNSLIINQSPKMTQDLPIGTLHPIGLMHINQSYLMSNPQPSIKLSYLIT